MAERPNASAAGIASEAAYAAGGTSPAERNLPPPRPRFMDLTPEDNVVARRLLASVFPNGVEV